MCPVEYQESQPKSVEIEDANLSIVRRKPWETIPENGSKEFQFSRQIIRVHGNGSIFTFPGLSNKISDHLRISETDGEVTVNDLDKPGHSLVLKYLPNVTIKLK